MASQLSPQQPVYGLRASAFDESKPMPTVEELAIQYLHDVREVQSHGPYQLCGMSFGGLVAYEMATMLQKEGENVGIVALFDTGNPAHYRNLSIIKMIDFNVTYLVDRLLKYLRRIVRGEMSELMRDARQFLMRNVNAVVWKVLRICGRISGVPMHKYVRDEFTLYAAAGKAYTPKRYDGRVVLFRAEGRTAEYGGDLSLGWDEAVRGSFQVHLVPGSHLTLMQNPNVRFLTEQLSKYLAPLPASGVTIRCAESKTLNPKQ